MKTLLIEIGTEEIPAGYIRPALDAFAGLLLKKLDDLRIDHGRSKVYGTPRRLAVMVYDVAVRQSTISEEVMGPPERVAFDQSGKPLVPAIKFAEKIGINPDRLTVKETEKGRYACAQIVRKGLPSKTILKTILPDVIRSIPFPKTMRWGSQSISFARPIQSILCLLEKDSVGFELGVIKSGRHSFGHRFMSPGRIKISSPESYLELLEKAHVIADMDLRRRIIEQEIKKAAENVNGSVLPDKALIETVAQLVELPAVATGSFDEKFLSLPDEILITAMREHQKYFAVSGEDGRLMPNFIVVNNTPARKMDLVVKGHERVLRARLEDAMFFYKKDAAIPLEDRVEHLKDVLFQANLGTLYDKTVRVKQIAGFMTEAVFSSSGYVSEPDLKNRVEEAAWLCKADLISQVVVEFPRLQGVMGRIYAGLSRKPESVSLAIEEHYRPVFSGGPLPETTAGSILAIADKLDSLCGCFSVGLIPSGASDPYALRRQGIGIIQIILSRHFMVSLRDLVNYSLELFIENDPARIDEVSALVLTFLKDRMAHLLVEEGYSKDVVASVIAVSSNFIPELWKKASALEQLKKAPDFEPLAAAFKRVVNIIRKSETEILSSKDLTVRTDIFEHPCEEGLFKAFEKVRRQASAYLDTHDYESALKIIASLKTPVDEFFNGVLVMAPDSELRKNRLALLSSIALLFENLADFSKLSTP